MEVIGFDVDEPTGRIRWVETETSARPLKHRAEQLPAGDRRRPRRRLQQRPRRALLGDRLRPAADRRRRTASDMVPARLPRSRPASRSSTAAWPSTAHSSRSTRRRAGLRQSVGCRRRLAHADPIQERSLEGHRHRQRRAVAGAAGAQARIAICRTDRPSSVERTHAMHTNVLALGRPLAGRVHQVQHLHQLLPGFGGHRPLPRPQIRRAAGAALSRERPAACRPIIRSTTAPAAGSATRSVRPASRSPRLNARARAQIVADNGMPLRNRLLGRNELLGKLGSIAPAPGQLCPAQSAEPRPGRKGDGHRPRSAAADAGAPTAPLASGCKRTAPSSGCKSDKKVVYYHGCATMYYEPFVGQAAVAVFEHNGYEVIVPPQNCCGLPLLSNGEFDAAAEVSPQQRRPAGRLCRGRLSRSSAPAPVAR